MLEIVILVTALMVCLTMVSCVRIAMDGLLPTMKENCAKICQKLSNIDATLGVMDCRLDDLADDADYWRKRDEQNGKIEPNH